MDFLKHPLTICSRKRVNENIGTIDISDKETVKNFCDWIYGDAKIYSDRKYQRYYSYYFLRQTILPYKKQDEEELLNLYGYEDIPPIYD